MQVTTRWSVVSCNSDPKQQNYNLNGASHSHITSRVALADVTGTSTDTMGALVVSVSVVGAAVGCVGAFVLVGAFVFVGDRVGGGEGGVEGVMVGGHVVNAKVSLISPPKLPSMVRLNTPSK